MEKYYQYHLDELFYNLYKHRTLRTLFDDQSSEWDDTSIDEKEKIYNKLMSSGRPLISWLYGYIGFYGHELANKQHVLKRLPNTLQELADKFNPKHSEEILKSIIWLKSNNLQSFTSLLKLLKSKEEIDKILTKAYSETDNTLDLLEKFERLKLVRRPFYINIKDLEEIVIWKLLGQEGRQREFRKKNTNDNVIAITKAAFLVTHPSKDYETELRLKLLTALAGVEVPVASAILTLCFPEEYSVIDFRNWRQVFPENSHKSQYTFKDYVRYLCIIQYVAIQFEVTPQQIDVAIWQIDKERDGESGVKFIRQM